MAYNEISDTRVQNGAIANSALFFDLRDNPKGIAAGDTGAPRIVHGALAGPGVGSDLLPIFGNGSLFANFSGSIFTGSGYQVVELAPTARNKIIIQKDGTYRIRVGANSSTSANARVYVNGAAVGDVVSAGSTMVYLNQDFDLSANDEVQLYFDRGGGSAGFIFQFLCQIQDPSAARLSA